jgi:hypothetical protein
MTERPILFSGPMVRALLAGTKTQTRRTITDHNSRGNMKASELLLDDPRTYADPGPSPAGNPGHYLHAYVNAPVRERNRGWKPGDCDPTIMERLYPWVFPGDRLWVRENGWERPERTPKMMREGADTWAPYYYDADGILPQEAADFKAWGFKRRPSIHMPRKACRLVLEVTGLRVERLQEISEADCRAEGCTGGHGSIPGYVYSATPREHYMHIWTSLNGAASWAANPWVWVIEFRRSA